MLKRDSVFLRKEECMNYRGFRELECYKQARQLRMMVSAMIKKFPAHEKYLLSTQMTDAARSVTANMAEGYGRFTYADTRHFFVIARGSTSETMEHIITAADEQYISATELNTVIEQCEQVYKLINGYISYLDKSKLQTR
jgi:four helix bundle protein